MTTSANPPSGSGPAPSATVAHEALGAAPNAAQETPPTPTEPAADTPGETAASGGSAVPAPTTPVPAPVASAPSASAPSASATRITPGLIPSTPPVGPASASGPRTLTPKPVAWRSWPIVDSKLEAIGIILVVVGASVVLWRQTESPVTVALCALAMAATVWRQFVPTFIELSALGVTMRTLRRTRRVPWLSIDRYVVGNRGVSLSSAGAPLEALRGLYLPWGTHRDEVLASLRYYLPRAEEAKA